MILTTRGSFYFFSFSAFARYTGILHGVFTRDGGYSAPPFHSLNVGIAVGDEPDTVAQNRKTVAECLGNADLVFLRQTHGNDVVIFDKDATDASRPEDPPPCADAMISNIPGKMLAIQVADCQAVMLYDPVQQVVANVHSGWRGSIQNIAGKCLDMMKSRFGCRPADIIAGVAPSLGPCCSEFIHYKAEIPETFWRYKDRRRHFDFWSVTRDQLAAEGLLPENIELSNLCTRCNDHLFYSYRKTNQTGRFVSIIGINQSSDQNDGKSNN